MNITLRCPIESSGWGRAASNLAKSLSLLPNSSFSLIPLKEEFPSNTDLAIQFFLPQNLKWKFSRKNVCYFFYETNTIKYTAWPENLALMDEIWVSTEWLKGVLINDGIKVPIQVVPIPVDTAKYFRDYEPIIEKEGEFLFYWIGDLNRRKNLPAAIRAFHLEFEPHEPVNLVIKVSKSQVFVNEYKRNVKEICTEIKKGLKLFKNPSSHKEEIIITSDEISDNHMLSLHKNCDCFISTSYGEGYNLPALDALGFGKTPIVTGWSGHTDFINNKNGWLTDYTMENVHGMLDVIQDLYCGYEEWAEISISHLRKNMREAYENSDKKGKLSKRGITDIHQFSYHKIASQIYEQQKESKIYPGLANSRTEGKAEANIVKG